MKVEKGNKMPSGNEEKEGSEKDKRKVLFVYINSALCYKRKMCSSKVDRDEKAINNLHVN